MKIDWSRLGWRIYPDDADGNKPPERYVKADLHLEGPVILHLTEEDPPHGWVLAAGYKVKL